MSNLDKVLYLVAPVIGVIGSHGRKEYGSADQDLNEQPPLKTADELMNDFSNDEDGANSRYNDKIIRVSGIIKSIQQNNSIQTIFLSTSSALSSVICHFAENCRDQLNQLRPWQPVVVKGVCAGILKHVVLEKCELER
jgi:tRNA_anti-like